MTTPQKYWRWSELLALFIGGPILLCAMPGVFNGGRLFLFLLIVGLLSGAKLYFDPGFDRSQLWNAKPIVRALPWMLVRWVIVCGLLTVIFALLAGTTLPGIVNPVPERLFSLFDRDKTPRFLPILIAVFYPWLSVYPQNLLYRAFFCHRYEPLLGRGWLMIVANAVAFSLGHIMFNNWVALLLTFVGGLMFTRSYLRWRSLFVATVEHAMYGVFCLYLGLGVFLVYRLAHA